MQSVSIQQAAFALSSLTSMQFPGPASQQAVEPQPSRAAPAEPSVDAGPLYLSQAPFRLSPGQLSPRPPFLGPPTTLLNMEQAVSRT